MAQKARYLHNPFAKLFKFQYADGFHDLKVKWNYKQTIQSALKSRLKLNIELIMLFEFDET